jgi:hypothetical protein
MTPSRTGVVLIAFLLCPTSAFLWVGKWRWAIVYLGLHIASAFGVVGLAYAGVEPLQSWGRARPETVLMLANAIVALPAFIHASRYLDEPPSKAWFSKWYAVVAAYAVIGVSIYHYAKPFLVA